MDLRRALLLTVFLAGVCAVVGGGIWQLSSAPSPAEARTEASVRTTTLSEGLAALRVWDERRQAAWADGDPSALSRLYAPGSRTGARDRAMLTAYAGRGLRVVGMRQQVLAAQVAGSGPGWVTLRVTDRLAAATVVGHGLRRPLPRARAGVHVVALVREGGGDGWVVREVRPDG